MIWDNPCLDRLVERETFAQMIALLKPAELAVAALRADGLDDVEIAAALGISRQRVSQRIQAARERILAALPEAAYLLEGRERLNSARPLLNGAEPGEWLTVPQAAEILQLHRESVRARLRTGRYPRARRDARGQWLIPLADLDQPVTKANPCDLPPGNKNDRQCQN